MLSSSNFQSESEMALPSLQEYIYQVNIQNLLLARYAAAGMSAIGWGNDCNEFKLLHTPKVSASIAEGDSTINATLLFLLYNILVFR